MRMSPSAAKLHVNDVTMTFKMPAGAFTALAPITLSIPQGRFVSLIGPSGCGKSTIFNIVAGLLSLRDRPRPDRRRGCHGPIGRVGYMLQKDLLLPWRTVLDNVILGMEIQRRAAEGGARARLAAAAALRTGGFRVSYPPRFRAACASARRCCARLLFDTDVILLDEPFGALDAQTKSQMQEWLLALFSDFGTTVLFVTHDVEEAIYLSDELHVMATPPRPDHRDHARPSAAPAHCARACSTPAFLQMKEYCLDLLDVNLAYPQPGMQPPEPPRAIADSHARMNQRVRAKRGPMTSSARCG